jgi:TPR repeat protein
LAEDGSGVAPFTALTWGLEMGTFCTSVDQRTGTLAICEKAAEQGLPTAQLALAQLYAARRAGPKDMVHAYMWFLIAGEQICQPLFERCESSDVII